MIRHHDIPWFNPRQMDDATVRALSTGREDLLRDFFLAARQRLREPSAGKHWLVLGPRGAGKSFFLRLVQCRFAEAMNLEGKSASIVLLPEEQPNVFSPHEWLQEVQRLLPGHTRSKGQSPVWQVKDEAHAWQTALESLLDTFKGDLLVIAVENFDQLLAQAFDNDVRASRLRNLMENEPRIMLLASAVEGEFDEAYEKRLFRQFEHHSMPRWDERDHRDYLTRRAKFQDKEPTNRQLAKIDAYSRFTGGSARTAAVLAASILDEQDPLSASHDLMATLDRMSDYYRALIEKMPPNTRKIFDNLVRGGEPASQVELANRIQARQSDISKAFRWLTDYGYVINEKQPGSKEHSYRVSDRLFVQFYRMRYIDPDQPCQLAILADLLAATIEFPNKWQFAESYLGMEKHAEVELMARLACDEQGVDVKLLPEGLRNAESLVKLGKEWMWLISSTSHISPKDFTRACLNRFETDDALRKAYDSAKALASAVVRKGWRGSERVAQIEQVLSLPPVSKLMCFAGILCADWSEKEWETIKIYSKQLSSEELGEGMSKERLSLMTDYPLSASLAIGANAAISENRWGTTDGTAWAALATKLWLQSGHAAEAAKSFSFCSKGVYLLITVSFKPLEAIAAVRSLREATQLMPSKMAETYLGMLGMCFEDADLYAEAVECYEEARSFASMAGNKDGVIWHSERRAWCLGILGQVGESIREHELARAHRSIQLDSNNEAWNIGQIARHLAHAQTVAESWKLIDQMKFADQRNTNYMLHQLGDAVWDSVRIHGPTAAFGFGRKLLTDLASRPQYSASWVIRAWWLEMLDVGVPITLLHDLLHEVPITFTDANDTLMSLCNTLEAWLDYLSATPEKRTEQLRRLDPDLSATLEGFSKNLSPKAQHRYGIVPNSVKS